MPQVDYNYKKLRTAQDLNKRTLEAIGMKLLQKSKDGIFEMPDDSIIASYINSLAEKREIKHYRLKGEHDEIYLFDNDEIISDLEIIEVEAKKSPEVIKIQCYDEKVTVDDEIPLEISRIDSLFRLPKTLFNSGSCIYFLCKNEKSVYNANWEYSSESNEILNKTSFGRFLISIHFNSLKGWNNNPKDWSINRYYKCDGITSQFLGIKKITFKEVGGYNENFPFAGFEDYEFWIRLKKYGINAFIDTQVLITHNELDKLSPKQWFARKFRGGITQKVAVDLGFKELKRNESRLKSIVFNILYIIQPTILFLINRKTKILDRFSFKVFKALSDETRLKILLIISLVLAVVLF